MHRLLCPVLVAVALFAPAPSLAQTQPATESGPTRDQDGLIVTSVPFEQVSPPLNFGYRKPLSFEQGIITLVNMGDTPLHILSARGECACTVASANKEIVQPGEPVDILVGLEVPPTIGAVYKQVLIDVEGYKFPFTTGVEAESGYPVRVNGGGVASVVVERQGRITLDSIEGRPFNVIAVNGTPPRYVDFNPETDRPRTEYVIEHDFRDLAPIDLPRWVVIETDHPGAWMVPVEAMIAGTPRLSRRDAWRPVVDHIFLGSIPMDEPTQTVMVMTGKPLVPGQKFTCRSRSLDARVDIVGARKPAEGGGIQIDLKVTPRGSFQGFLHAIVDITLDGEATALEIFARVMPKDQIPPGATRTN